MTMKFLALDIALFLQRYVFRYPDRPPGSRTCIINSEVPKPFLCEYLFVEAARAHDCEVLGLSKRCVEGCSIQSIWKF